MVAPGNWGLTHRDGGPELVTAMMDELRELHPGIPQPIEQLHAAYQAAMSDVTGSLSSSDGS